MGNSRDWQQEVIDFYKRSNLDFDVTFFNPRLPIVDSSFEIEKQINWELEHLEEANSILMVILGTSKSPISLLELGLHMRTGKLNVVCEEDYYRFTNVKVTCEKYGVPVKTNFDEFLYGKKL